MFLVFIIVCNLTSSYRKMIDALILVYPFSFIKLDMLEDVDESYICWQIPDKKTVCGSLHKYTFGERNGVE